MNRVERHVKVPLEDRSVISPVGLIVFASAEDADFAVAGLPAAARAVREARLAGLPGCWISAGPGWQPRAEVRSEIDRLADTMPVHFGDGSVLAAQGSFASVAVIAGDRLPPAAVITACLAGEDCSGRGVRVVPQADVAHAVERIVACGPGSRRRLAHSARAVLRGTAKPTDGIVSRYVNRPLSQAMSGVLLRFPAMRPIHATAGTALLAMLMFASLLVGTPAGLVTGAVLFQASSVFDGVDGEIARATFRSSHFGAKADSLVDAATNLAFLLGVSINLQLQGSHMAAGFGYAGLLLLGAGLWLIGRASARSNAPFSFDVVKEHYRSRGAGGEPGRTVRILTFLTSRDFFALGFALMIAAGLAPVALALFAIAAVGWLGAVVVALAPRTA